MKRLLLLLAEVAALVFGVFAVPALADPPTSETDINVDAWSNPCTGEFEEVSTETTIYYQVLDGRSVVRFDTTIHTSGGFVGSGAGILVQNGQDLISVAAITLTNGSGDVITVEGLLVIDLSSGDLVAYRPTETTCVTS